MTIETLAEQLSEPPRELSEAVAALRLAEREQLRARECRNALICYYLPRYGITTLSKMIGISEAAIYKIRDKANRNNSIREGMHDNQ